MVYRLQNCSDTEKKDTIHSSIPVPEKVLTVASAGFNIGKISDTKILKSPAPSIFPDSVISYGTDFAKFFIRMISHGDINSCKNTAI